MKFSLKDLLWSVTLASFGLATFMIIITWPRIYGTPQTAISLMVFMPILLSPGPLWGAAIGNLFHRTMTGVRVGALLWVILALPLLPSIAKFMGYI